MILLSGGGALKRRAVFILGAKCTITTPNAKPSTLLQGCFFSVFVFDSIHDSVTMHGVSHHLASPMPASAFASVPIGGFSTESGLFLLYVKNRLERGFAPADC